MAKKETEPYLIEDVAPKNAKEIAEVAKRCKAAQKKKDKAKEQEDVEKDKLREFVRKAGLEPIDGKIVFTVENMTITVTPKEDSVKIKEAGETSQD